MFCSQCGKEISDNSKFCCSCGFKIDVKLIENVEEYPIPPVNSELPTENQDTKEESSIMSDGQTVLNPPLKTNHDVKKGYGWLVLLFIYSYGMSVSQKKDPYSGQLYSLIINLFGLIIIFPIYFWIRKNLIKKNFWKGHIGSSSCLSGIITWFLISFLVVGSISFIGGYEKRKEIEEFVNNLQTQNEISKKREVEYSKMMTSIPKTESELKDKVLKIDEYKNFLIKKNSNFVGLINFLRKTNSKYKKDKSVDEQINKLEKINSDVTKSSIDCIDDYRKYLITGNVKFYNQYQQGYEKQQPLKDDGTQLLTNIGKSL